jgi:general stress protein YciG
LFPHLHQHCELQEKARVAAAPNNGVQPGRKRMATTKSGGSKRGFAAMDPAKQREIASKGGKAGHGGGRKSSRSH